MRLMSVLLLAVLLSCSCAGQAQDWAKAKLEKSPRHREWVTVKNGDRQVNSFIVYPEVKNKATAVLVIHEIFGLTDWVREVADELAANGYIAIAPDLLSGMGPKGGGTAELGGDDNAMKAIRELPPEQITGDLNAAAKYVTTLPAANGKFAVMGFCWGGGQAMRYATNNHDLKAALVFYGSPLKDDNDLARVTAPVYAFYGEKDARVTSTLPKTRQVMKNFKKTFVPVVYKDAGHGFMRSGEAPDATAADAKARADGWTRVKEILKKL
jgi:carboxymethylenebutenolidase